MTLPMIGAPDIERLRMLIYESSGMRLSDSKRGPLAEHVAQRMRALGISSFTSYHAQTKDRRTPELALLLDAVSTLETSWFRDPAQFSFFTDEVFPSWRMNGRPSRSVRAWSCACATGEEAYSLGMLMLDHFPPASGWTCEVFASDLSTRALEQAKAAVWPLWSGGLSALRLRFDGLRARRSTDTDLPANYLRRFMLRGCGAELGKMKAGPLLRGIVELHRINLNAPPYPVSGLFDLIFCRNVFIYFDAESKRRALHALCQSLVPGGYLVVGAGETLTETGAGLQRVGPSIYQSIQENSSR